ncbi:uncharacterized protein [Dermacentor andersoni]|uniref:uncharacterized protein isoform X5 n=1 Tax=Dermacentor andersoni TaxID=34620 RepID=UPI003B3BDCFB
MGPKRVLSAEEIEARKKRRAEQQRRRYAAKCGLERERMLARKREVERRRMECASDRERLLARKREAERHRVYGSDRERLLARKREAERRRMECASERERVLARKREAERRRMECASERERVLAQKREAERRRMECPTERERVLAQKREAERRRVAAMSPEERNEHLAHKREVQMRRSDAARQQRIWAAFASASLVAAQVTVAITIVFQPDILLSVYCSTHRTPPVESTKAVQTEATECISGRMDVAVGTTIVDRGVCQSTQTLPPAQRVHRWADTTDLDVHDNGPYVQGISGSIGVAS